MTMNATISMSDGDKYEAIHLMLADGRKFITLSVEGSDGDCVKFILPGFDDGAAGAARAIAEALLKVADEVAPISEPVAVSA